VPSPQVSTAIGASHHAPRLNATPSSSPPHDELRRPLEPQPPRVQHHVVVGHVLAMAAVVRPDVSVALLVGLVHHRRSLGRVHAERVHRQSLAPRLGRHDAHVEMPASQRNGRRSPATAVDFSTSYATRATASAGEQRPVGTTNVTTRHRRTQCPRMRIFVEFWRSTGTVFSTRSLSARSSCLKRDGPSGGTR
jgi:hypothetical protein